MFTEFPGSRKTIGDVDVVYHAGLYHLFHLVLPNQDFIAHAISDNALDWRRVDNALFIGHPGSWDDLMLWTVHVSPNPFEPGWRMFYTGLSRRDRGLKQRIGLAFSHDLNTWRKAPVSWQDRRGAHDPELVQVARRHLPQDSSDNIRSPHAAQSSFPLEPHPAFYESEVDGPRRWVSFRDPFYFADECNKCLLVAARTNWGPLIRRGCVAWLEETAPNEFIQRPPLHAPQMYDDIEVPNMLKIDDEYYLIGSLREDAKIRYWHTHQLGTPWKNFYDNVLLPQGNYAGRICYDPQGILLWNFFTEHWLSRTIENLMPPPKRLVVGQRGQLRATTFERIAERAIGQLPTERLRALKQPQEGACVACQNGQLQLVSEAGFQAFVFEEPVACFELSAYLRMQGTGKCGLVSRLNAETHDGYYLSLDLMKGIAQMRAWGTGPLHSGEQMLRFESLQAGYWYDEGPRDVWLRLIAFGSYHELCINERVILSLADSTFAGSGLLGFYVETANLHIDHLQVTRLSPPTQTDEHLTTG